MKILILRTIQSDRFEEVIVDIKRNFPKAVIYALDNSKHNEIASLKNIKKIFQMKKAGDYSIFKIGIQNIKKIRKEKFSIVYFPMKQNRISGFENVILLLYFLKAKKWFSYHMNIGAKKVSKAYIFNIFTIQLFSLALFIPFSVLSLFLIFAIHLKSKYRKNKDSKEWHSGYGDV